jgi:ABC-type antimicrobial peptide transport system permease subunit
MVKGAGSLPLDIEIVGLVKDSRYSHLKDSPPPLFFLPYRQRDGIGALNFYVQSGQPFESMSSTIRSLVSRLDPALPVKNLRPLVAQVGDTVALDRLISTLSFAFAALATLLASIGLYGVLAYNFAQRTRELGLRIALGASIGRVRRMVFGQVGRITLVGGTVGVGAAVALGRLAESQLFQVPGFDPVIMFAAAVGVVTIALGAGTIPAWRASRIDPARVLRCE